MEKCFRPRGTNQVWICFVVRAGFGRGELDLEGDMARPDLLLYELEGCHRGCESWRDDGGRSWRRGVMMEGSDAACISLSLDSHSIVADVI